MTVHTGSGRAQCCCVRTLTDVWVLQKAGNFLTTWTFLSFTIRILLHGITTRVNNIPSNTVVLLLLDVTQNLPLIIHIIHSLTLSERAVTL